MGYTKNIEGFTSVDLGALAFGFDNKHYSHSPEFRSNIVNERPYWKSVGFDFKLSGDNFKDRFN